MSDFRKQMQRTDSWMHMRKIPAAIRRKIHTYYTYLWHSEEGMRFLYCVRAVV